jgi:hypothetical protein
MVNGHTHKLTEEGGMEGNKEITRKKWKISKKTEPEHLEPIEFLQSFRKSKFLFC